MKQFLIVTLLLFTSHIFANESTHNVTFSIGPNKNNSLSYTIGNTSKDQINFNSLVIKVDNNVCVNEKFNKPGAKLLPQEYLRPYILDLENCFKLSRKAEFAGMSDSLNTFVDDSKHLRKKQMYININYTKNGSITIESSINLMLLFIQQ